MRRLRCAERGDMLLEALVGILIMTFLGLGLAYATGRAMTAKRQTNIQSITVSQMRSGIQEKGISDFCADNSGVVAVGAKSVQLTANCETVQVTGSVDGKFIIPSTITNFTLSTESNTDLYGGSGVMTMKK